MKYVIKITRSEGLFVCLFFIYAFLQCLQQTEYGATWMNYLRAACLILLPLKLHYDKMISKRYIPFWSGIFVLGFVISYNSGDYSKIFPLLFFLFAANNVDAKVLVKTSFTAIVIVMIMAVIGSFTGIIPMKSTFTGLRNRYYLGFQYTSYSSNFFLHAFIMWIYLKNRRPTILDVSVVFGLNAFLYYFTRTRMVFVTSLLLLLIWIILPYVKYSSQFFKTIFGTSFVWCAGISILLQIFYNPSIAWMSILNYIMSTRLRLGNDAIQRYGFSLFGQSIQWNMTEGSYLYVDSSYLNIGLNYGVILLILTICGFTWMMMKSIDEHNIYLVIALFGVAIHSMTDPQLLSLMYNPFLLLLCHSFSVTLDYDVKESVFD